MNKTIKFLLLAVVIGAVFALPAMAQDAQPDADPNTISFNGVSFSYDPAFAANVTVSTFAGDDVSLEQPGGPQPPYTEFRLFNAAPNESFLEVPVSLRVYELADIEGYADSQAEVDALRTLLTNRPDLTTFEISGTSGESSLPFLPVFPAAQVIRALTNYVVTPQLNGIAYVTTYRQDASPLTSGDLFYTVQAISVDGSHYVVAVLNFDTSLFETEIPTDFDMDAFVANIDAYFNESIASINAAEAGAFVPQLNVLTDMINTINFNVGLDVPVPTPPADAGVVPPTTEAGAGGGDALGGLAGEWSLVSYGPLDAPTAVMSGDMSRAPATIRFDAEGVTGNSGCNSFGGSFTYDNTSITFSNLFSTMMACEGVMEQEQAYLSALNTATSYTISGETLQITYDSGVLVFNRLSTPEVAPTVDASANTDPTFGGLAGSWTLSQYSVNGTDTQVLTDTPVTISFDTQGVSGNAGCNNFTGNFTYSFGALTFSPLVTTRMACLSEEANAQETAVLSALQNVQSFTISADGQLVMTYDSGSLVFDPAE